MESYNIIRVIIVIISGLSIFFGYKLFYLVTERQGNLIIKDKNRSLALSDVGPGVFFALFGAIVLVSVLVTQPYTEQTVTKIPTVDNQSDPVTSSPSIVISSRSPASEGTDNNEFEILCVNEEHQDEFNEGIELFETASWFYKNEPYKLISDSDKEGLIILLNKLQAPPEYLAVSNGIASYVDHYHLLKSFLLLYHLSNSC